MAEIVTQDSTVQSLIRLSCFLFSTERIPSADADQAILLPQRAVLHLSRVGDDHFSGHEASLSDKGKHRCQNGNMPDSESLFPAVRELFYSCLVIGSAMAG
jgi:hypothetical protein